jgi:hypothetical protein
MEGAAELHGFIWCHKGRVIFDVVLGVVDDLARAMMAMMH